MAEAKYVVGDHRNGDAKIELDANKREQDAGVPPQPNQEEAPPVEAPQEELPEAIEEGLHALAQFSGLTKEELRKYAEDPFWVRLRWFMFVLFWLLWLGMLAGAIAIIVRAPKCAAPVAKTWYEVGPLVEMYPETEDDISSSPAVDYQYLEEQLPLLEKAKVQGVFIKPCEDTYEVLESTSCLDKFKKILEKAKKSSIKLIVDLTANFVPLHHSWFVKSENKTEGYEDYFVWSASSEYMPDGKRPQVPNNWVSRSNEPAWSWSSRRQQYYLHQYRADQPDLNFRNPLVVKLFDAVLKAWMDAGADGVRLHKARQLLVDPALPNELPSNQYSAAPTDYLYYNHPHTTDQLELTDLLTNWTQKVTGDGNEKVFTLYEDGVLKPEWYRLRNASVTLRPPSAARIQIQTNTNFTKLAGDLDKLASKWTILQLTSSDPLANTEVVSVAMVLPVTPLLAPAQVSDHNDTLAMESLGRLSALREDASIKFGERRLEVLSDAENTTQFLACARWKTGHTGYVVVFNPGQTARVNLTALQSLPDTLAVHHVSHQAKLLTNYTSNLLVHTDDILVPTSSAIVLSYVPKSSAEQ